MARQPRRTGSPPRSSVWTCEAFADLLGRLIDTFVTAQLRPELGLGERPTAVYHRRQEGGRREIDLLIERSDGAIVALEIKAANAIDRHDARHLRWLRDELASTNQFRAGIVFYTGPHVRSIDDDIWAVPICALWA